MVTDPLGKCDLAIVRLDPEEPDFALELCDLGAGFPELGTVSLAELRQITSSGGLRIERDRFFTAQHPMSVYTRAAC